MTYDEYWNQSPRLVIDYRKAWELKLQQEDNNAWLQGLYTYKAFATVLSNAFRKKGTPAENYFEEPLGATRNKSVAEQRAEEFAKLQSLARSINARKRTN